MPNVDIWQIIIDGVVYDLTDTSIATDTFVRTDTDQQGLPEQKKSNARANIGLRAVDDGAGNITFV